MRDDSQEDRDRAEITDVIRSDLRDYLAKNREAWRDHWLQDPRMISIMECSGLLMHKGYGDFERGIFEAMDQSTAPSASRARQSGLQITVRGDMAWAYFDQTVADSDDPMDPPAFSHNVRVLERVDGAWKIAFHGVWAPHVSRLGRPMIEVDKSARVLWTNPAAEHLLAEFGALRISHGTLRASRPSWDRDLRTAIQRAGELQGYVAVNAALGDTEQPIRYPVVLGEDDEAQLLVCWVEIADYQIYVSFSDPEHMARRIAVAGVILGFSEMQKRLARQIADGHDLTTAADVLGISPNTAKTHLRRMFDKANVNSQTALVRVILSLA